MPVAGAPKEVLNTALCANYSLEESGFSLGDLGLFGAGREL